MLPPNFASSYVTVTVWQSGLRKTVVLKAGVIIVGELLDGATQNNLMFFCVTVGGK